MKIHAFDQPTGFYHFELTDLQTELHQHPAVEIIIAHHGTFNLQTAHQQLTDLTHIIIDQNITHQVRTEQGQVELMMIECPTTHFYQSLANQGVQFENGIALILQSFDYQKVIEDYLTSNQQNELDQRIQNCLDFFQQNEMDYQTMLTDLCQLVHLSESRLSHLFKAETGISIKQYAVWNRLKKTVKLVLEKEIPLSAAAMQCGFYDAAHWSNAFKKHLGINPASAYNSRILQ